MRVHSMSGTLIAAAAGLALGGSLAAQQPAGGQAQMVGIEQLRENPKQYEGKVVRIEGEVEELLGPRLLSVAQDNLFDLFDQDVFVYVPEGLAVVAREETRVRVTGTFRTFVGMDIEEELGWFEPAPDVEAEFNRRHVVVASQLTTFEGDDLVVWSLDEQGRPVARAGRAGAGAERPVGTAGMAAANITTLQPLTEDDPEELVGRYVSLEAPVGRVMGDRTFTIGKGDQQVLALVAEPLRAKGQWKQDINPGSNVMISGIVLEVPDRLPLPKMSAQEREILEDREIYIYATRIEKKG